MLQTDVVPLQSHLYRAARWAVFTPCCGVSWKQRPIRDVVGHVRNLWTKLLDGLADVQMSGIGTLEPNGRLALAYSKNCPPFGVAAKRSQRCKRAKICPFCYAREYVGKPMQSLEAALFKPGDGKIPLADINKTVIVDYTVSIEFQPNNRNWQTTPAGRAPVWASLLKTIDVGRKREVEQIPSYGGAVLHRVQFDTDKWTLLRSGVFLCHYDEFKLREFQQASCEAVRAAVHPPTREELSRAVGRAFRYPDNVLVTAPEIVREYVENLRSKHLLARYGAARPAKT